jgi:CheY-like chemotaxis protein
MYKVEPGSRGKLFGRVSKNAFPCRIDYFEVSIETPDTKHVKCKLKQTLEFLSRRQPTIFLLRLWGHSAHYTFQMASPQPMKTKRHILVVDDDRTLRHALVTLLESAGFQVTPAADGAAAVTQIHKRDFDLVILDLGLPRVSGIDVLAELKKLPSPPRVIVVTADDTPTTVIRAIRENAYQYIVKPTAPATIVELAQRVFTTGTLRPIKVVSARAEWLELLVPCDLETAERIQGFIEKLDADLPVAVRDAIGQAFRELLMNAVEWGGQLDPDRTVRIACLRTNRMILYRIADPGQGFSPEQLAHAAISNAVDEPYAHMRVREEKGLRPGGFGLLMTRTLVDELIYNEAHNEVVFVKYVDR